MGSRVRDSGAFLASCVSAGVVGGLASSLWAALYAGLRGLPLWSPLALYDTHFLGLSPRGVITRSLAEAVVAGVVWQAMLGMAVGAFFALVAGTLIPAVTLARAAWLVGGLYGLLLWVALTLGRLRLESPAISRDLPGWAMALVFALMGLVVGALAGRTAEEKART